MLIFSASPILFAQDNNLTKNKSLQHDNQLVNDYQYMSFTILNLDSESERQSLINDLQNNSNLKNINISEHNQLSAYVKKDYIIEFKNYFKNNDIETTMKNPNKTLGPDDGSPRVVIPENMKPVYIDTGNPEEDKQKYTEAKKKLLEEHPEYIQQ